MFTELMSRREFLAAGGSLVVTFSWSALLPAARAQESARGKTVAPDQVDGFVSIDQSGAVTVYSGKVDLGTGVRTALTQIAAEELDVPLERVTVIQGDTLVTPDQGPTFGSLSIQNGGMQIRQAAATARQALLNEAAKRLGIGREELATRNGEVLDKSGSRHIGYNELIGGKRFELALDKAAPLKDPATYTIVGKPVARLDIPAKVTGEFMYMQDFRRPGMLHARVIRPAGMGSQLVSYDDAPARQIRGFVQTLRQENFLAVVAENEWAAIKASDAVKAKWSEWEGLPDSSRLWDHVRSTKINRDDVVQNIGNTADAMPGASRKLTASYDFAIHTHGSVGPSCAVAQWENGQLTCWTASQATHLLRKQLALMFGVPEQGVRAIYIDGSGCYGRNGHEDAAADAALLAKLTGRPVRVQWSRAEEHGWDPKGPPVLIDYHAGLGSAGNVAAWESASYVPDVPKTLQVALLTAQLAGMPTEASHAGSMQQSLGIPYTFPNIKAVAHRLADTPFRPSWIRTPGRLQNTFGNEAFLDEVASAAGVDPLEFRLRNLADQRGIELLQRLAKLAQWQPRRSGGAPSTGSGGDVARGRGVAYVRYELARTYIGAVADVEVNRKTGKIRVKRFAIAHDCGQIINPDGLRNQIEGNVVHTISRTLIEELKFNRSAVTSLDWISYPVITFPDVPDVAIALIDRPTEPPWGAGEPTASVVAPAISNAVFDAIGVRLRSVPFTAEKVLAALKKA
ncbi:MAG TPA: molybdopterin cofactor-binding domain-containing protein [Burkholderiaceae bacterium]|nr:molybdopterin cofactor-binding domain-containing protein [Burkholderiaceae bacterium]